VGTQSAMSMFLQRDPGGDFVLKGRPEFGNSKVLLLESLEDLSIVLLEVEAEVDFTHLCPLGMLPIRA
jgi:hypothetical protein